MSIKIKFEDEDGKLYKTPVIEDTDGVYRRPNVIHGDEVPKFQDGRKPGGFTKNTNKKKSKKRYA